MDDQEMITLVIYVSPGCPNCRFAREMARRTARAFPAVRVQVLDLGADADPPEIVFATPTYLLDGRLISLGNPDEEELFALLEERLAALSPAPPDDIRPAAARPADWPAR